MDLHAAYRQTHERLASLDEALGREDARLQPSPWEEVRDFFHYCDNYIDAVDRAAEHFAQPHTSTVSLENAAYAALDRHGISVVEAVDDRVRHYDPATKTLSLSRFAAPEHDGFSCYCRSH